MSKLLNIDITYDLLDVDENDLSHLVKHLRSGLYKGFNVTIPYKQTMMNFVTAATPEASMIGAINTIKVSSAGLRGYNTDGEGFLQHLTKDLGFDPRWKNIAVLGAGGASRSVCVYLCKAKPRRIAIFNRDRSKTIDLVHVLNMHNTGIEFIAADTVGHLRLEDADILVNTTSVGMNETDPSLVDARYLRRGMLVYDLVYSKKSTRLLEDARRKGCRTANGLGMLLYQGMAAFKIWTGRTPPKKIMAKAIGL